MEDNSREGSSLTVITRENIVEQIVWSDRRLNLKEKAENSDISKTRISRILEV